MAGSPILADVVRWPTPNELVFESFFFYCILVCPALFVVHASAGKGRVGEMCRVGFCLVGLILLLIQAIALCTWLWNSKLIYAIGPLLVVALPACGSIRRASARMRAVQLQRICMVLPALCILPRGLHMLEEAEAWNWAVGAAPTYAAVLANMATLLGLLVAWGVRVWGVRPLVRRGHARAVVTVQRRIHRLMPYLYALGVLLSVGAVIVLTLLLDN